MGALGSFKSSESAQPHVRLWLQLALRTEAASGPLIPLLQAGVGSPTEEAPSHGTCQTRSQRGQGAKARTVLMFLPAYLPEAPAPEASGQVISPGLKMLSNPQPAPRLSSLWS